MKKTAVVICAIIVVIALVFSLRSDSGHLQNDSGYFVDYTCGGNAKCLSGTVTRIIDGDTIVVGETHVRFALAAAPELSESGGLVAKEFIENTCPIGSKAIVDEDDKQTDGSYGRTIAKIYCNGIILNEALVSKGLGTIDRRFCTQSEFTVERWAQQHGC